MKVYFFKVEQLGTKSNLLVLLSGKLVEQWSESRTVRTEMPRQTLTGPSLSVEMLRASPWPSISSTWGMYLQKAFWFVLSWVDFSYCQCWCDPVIYLQYCFVKNILYFMLLWIYCLLREAFKKKFKKNVTFVTLHYGRGPVI